MAEKVSVFKRLAQALLNLGVRHVFLSADDDYIAPLLEGMESIICFKSCTAAFAAEAYAKITGLGSFLDSNNGGVEALSSHCKDPTPVVCVMSQEKTAPYLFDELSTLQRCETPVMIMLIEDGVTSNAICNRRTGSFYPKSDEKRTRERREITFMPKEYDVIDLVVKHLRDNMAPEEVIIVSDMAGLEKEFPGFMYEFQRPNGLLGWSVGATIGYAVASEGKRLIMCMTDLCFQAMVGELSTILKFGANTVIIVISSLYSPDVVSWDYTSIMDAIDKWTTKVYTEEQLADAIRVVNTEQKCKFCLIEVHVKLEDLADCVDTCPICYEVILNEESVVQYQGCEWHIFHNACVDGLVKKLCPVDRYPLAGRRKGWKVRNGKEVVADGDEPKPFPKPNISRRLNNIEDACSACGKRYRKDNLKATSLVCSHTYCWGCSLANIEICLICGKECDTWSSVIVEEDAEIDEELDSDDEEGMSEDEFWLRHWQWFWEES